MPYKPQPNERKHKRLIADATAETELADQELEELLRVAKSPETKAHIRGIQVRVLHVDKLLNQMMEIARLEDDE
jgi:hypothetical protein